MYIAMLMMTDFKRDTSMTEAKNTHDKRNAIKLQWMLNCKTIYLKKTAAFQDIYN